VKCKKFISGGQTGADQIFVEEAALLGFKTGGTMPAGWRTDDGPNPEWGKKYALKQHTSSAYPPRTRLNVLDADVTVWFGNTVSAGYICTKGAAEHHRKPFYVNPTPEQFAVICANYETINGAGNRLSKNPTIAEPIKAAFAALKEAI
jgi:hypothetical protein